MVNYELGKIYKIVCDKTGLIYVGSTAQKYLSLRLGGHRGKYRNYKRNGCNYVTSFKVLEHFSERIELIEMWPCSNRYELEKRERYWIETLNCVNALIPTRTKEEYYNDNKEKINQQHKVYWDNTKDKRKEKMKVYVDNNKDKITQYMAVYYNNNKDKIKEYQQNNREKRNDRRKELRDYQKTWCGNFVYNNHNNLLYIDVNLFN